MQTPRFSIVITCYQQREFIRAAVDSSLSQTYQWQDPGAQGHPAMEIIVVDDGSNDGSAELLESYGHSIHLSKVSQNRGAIAARNLGASLAKGQYLVFLDGDDVLMPWALEVYERMIGERQPKYILARMKWFHDTPVPLVTDKDLPGTIEFVKYINVLYKDRPAGLSASSFVVERAAFERAGGWTPGIFHLDCQEILTKLCCEGPMILVLDPCTAFYRIHSGNSIHQVPPFLSTLHILMKKECAEVYPGGARLRFRRRAWLGGLVVFWLRRSLLAGLQKDAIRLASVGWKMVLASIFTRSKSLIRGRCPVETMPLRVANSRGLPEKAGDREQLEKRG